MLPGVKVIFCIWIPYFSVCGLMRDYVECLPGEGSLSPDGILPSTGSTLPVLQVCDSPRGRAEASIQSINESGTALMLQTSLCVCPPPIRLVNTIRRGIPFRKNARCSLPWSKQQDRINYSHFHGVCKQGYRKLLLLLGRFSSWVQKIILVGTRCLVVRIRRITVVVIALSNNLFHDYQSY